MPKFRKKAESVVEARQLTEDFVVDGELWGREGDWLIREGNGNRFCMTNEESVRDTRRNFFCKKEVKQNGKQKAHEYQEQARGQHMGIRPCLGNQAAQKPIYPPTN